MAVAATCTVGPKANGLVFLYIVADKLSSKNSEVDFSVFKKVIKEIIRRYVTKLDASSEDEDVPRPDWPKSP